MLIVYNNGGRSNLWENVLEKKLEYKKKLPNTGFTLLGATGLLEVVVSLLRVLCN